MIYHPRSNQIIGIDIAQGYKHDISLARKTRKKLMQCQYVMADLGYSGLEEIGFKLLIPIKKSKGFSLSLEQKQFNRQLSRFRIKIEHINNQLKRFRILSERYRNRRKRFGLRVNLIAGLVNWMNRVN